MTAFPGGKWMIPWCAAALLVVVGCGAEPKNAPGPVAA